MCKAIASRISVSHSPSVSPVATTPGRSSPAPELVGFLCCSVMSGAQEGDPGPVVRADLARCLVAGTPARSPPGTFGWVGVARRQGPGRKAGGPPRRPRDGGRGGGRAGGGRFRRWGADGRGWGLSTGRVRAAFWHFFGVALVMRGPAGLARKGVESSRSEETTSELQSLRH